MLDPAALIDETLHDYRVAELLGSGGFGWVFRARHSFLGDRAIKVLYPWLARDRDQQERFRREAIAGDRLHHEHIIPVYDLFEEAGLLCIVMMLIDPPRTLAGRLREAAPLPAAQSAEIARQVGAALDHAHRHGVVHRDVTPNNVLLQPSGAAMLGDFGIARIVAAGDATHSGHIIGTPAYLSPEHLGGDVDARSDVYQFGLVLYQMVTGKIRTSPMEPLPAVTSINPSLPAGLDGVLRQALALDRPSVRARPVSLPTRSRATSRAPR